MSEILSQAEIDALIASLTAGQERATPPARPAPEATSRRRVRLYDFRRPDKFSKEQLRKLQIIHEGFARLLTTFFTANFRTVVQIVIGAVDQWTYEEFMRTVERPSVLCPFQMLPLPGTCVLDVSPVIAFPMLDRILGGPGSGVPRPRELTDIEQTLMTRIIHGILQALQEAWRSLVAVEPKPLRLESNPIFVQVAAPSEMVVTVAADVRVGEHVGVITLCFPYMTLEPLMGFLTAHDGFRAASSQRRVPGDRLVLEGRLMRTAVPLTVELGRAELTVRDLLGLEPGDVVVLDRRADEPCVVYVGDRPKFRGRPGTVGGRLAIEVQGVVERERADDEVY